MMNYADAIETIKAFKELNRHRDNMKFNQALQTAIDALEAMQCATECLPEKKFVGGNNCHVATAYNKCLDEVQPLFATIINDNIRLRNEVNNMVDYGWKYKEQQQRIAKLIQESVCHKDKCKLDRIAELEAEVERLKEPSVDKDGRGICEVCGNVCDYCL